MKKLLYKEFKLCMHPMIPLFGLFVFMLLIPNYIYQIPFFFTTNALFYSFQQSVLNNDLLFTALLPVPKRDSVKSKYFFVCIIELAMLLLYVPMMFLNRFAVSTPNSAGVDASVTLIAAGFVLFSVFNAVFMPSFYKTGYKAGKSFLKSTIAVFIWIFASEGFFIASSSLSDKVPFFGWVASRLDCFPASMNALAAQLTALGASALVFIAVTYFSYKRSVKNYEKVDL